VFLGSVLTGVGNDWQTNYSPRHPPHSASSPQPIARGDLP